ncbi:MAG: sugar-binding transcriptional regulator [Rhodobacteraceae bacterium]|nr:sugar-binding transcriptional regulator [Paracoccaceae bacterium]
MTRVNELRFITRIAQMYHVEGRRQAEIAKHLSISQATVSRMLKRAQAEGIVRTTIMAPSGIYTELEAGLREKYNLPEAIVVECTEDRERAIMARIGEAAAHFFEATLQTEEVIGVSSWSETILKMVDNVHPMRSGKAKHVVQTLGGMGNPAVQAHANQLTTRLARLTGAEPRLLNAPGVTQSREAKLVLVSDPYVRETTDLFRKVTLSIVGIGAVEPSSMLARSGNVFSESELAEVAEAGGVGDISLRFFDNDGQPVKTPLDERVIGMSLEDLAKIDRVIALAGGRAKTEAICGALKTGAIDVLITDKFTAERLQEPETDHRAEGI